MTAADEPTFLVHADQAVHDSERRLRTLIEEAPIAIVLSRGELIIYCNGAFATLYGFNSPKELIGTPVLDRVARSEHAEFAERSARRLRGEPVESTYELLLTRRDGSEFNCLVSVSEVDLADGAATLVFLQDLSERVRMEHAIRALNAGLEQRVQERTRELEQSNAALAEARDTAQAATRAKGQFLANMSHEIRTPMNAIIGLTDLALRNPALPPQVEGYLRNTKQAADSLLGIINDILDFSKIESGKFDIDRREFVLGEVLERVTAQVGLKAIEKGLTFRVDTVSDVPRRLVGDPLRLGQVLLNLCSNAMKFTDHGEVVLSTRLQPSGDEGRSRLRFIVRDTGIGIDPSQQDRLFSPFDQLDTSTTRKVGGTGLGLAISKQLVGLMGGEIKVRSALGQGSEFQIDLEFELPPGPTSQSHAPSRAQAIDELAVEGLRGRHILLVEDNDLNQIVAHDLLCGVAGAVVSVADNGSDALAVLMAGQPVDLVLMDVQMPGMDGFETTRQMRKIPALATLPVIAMTAHAMKRDRELCLEAGMNDYITKPFEPQQLFAVLTRWLPVTSEPNPAPAIDRHIGLRRCFGREELYRRVLVHFAQIRRGDAEELRRACAAGDADTMTRLVHDASSAAGTIGAEALAAAARDLHLALSRDDPALWPALVEAYAVQHSAVMADLARHLAGA